MQQPGVPGRRALQESRRKKGCRSSTAGEDSTGRERKRKPLPEKDICRERGICRKKPCRSRTSADEETEEEHSDAILSVHLWKQALRTTHNQKQPA